MKKLIFSLILTLGFALNAHSQVTSSLECRQIHLDRASGTDFKAQFEVHAAV